MRKVALLMLISLGLAVGCIGGPDTYGPTNVSCDDGRCDGFGDPEWEPNLDELNRIYRGREIESLEDAYSLNVQGPGWQYVAPTHVFGEGRDTVTIVPFTERDWAAVIEAMGADEIVIAMKHHRPEFREFDVAQLPMMDQATMLEGLKLRDTHLQVFVVGRDEAGRSRLVTLQSPQAYHLDDCHGRPCGVMGNEEYAPILFRIRFPSQIQGDSALRAQFLNNIRVMLMGFHSVAYFPSGDYNGGDEFATATPDDVREHTARMILALAGDSASRAWFNERIHYLYCAEYVYLALSAGLLVPVNEEAVTELLVEYGATPERAQSAYDAFLEQMEAYNEGGESTFVLRGGRGGPERNRLAYDYRLQLAEASADLRPAYEYTGQTPTEGLAFTPMTADDMIQQFIATVFDVALMAPQVGGIEAATAIRDGFVAQVELMRPAAESFTAGPSSFVPPSVVHNIALGTYDSFLGMDYVGHLVHENNLIRRESDDPDPQETPALDVCQEEFMICMGPSNDWRSANTCVAQTTSSLGCTWAPDGVGSGYRVPCQNDAGQGGTCLASGACGGTPERGHCPGSSVCCVE